LHVGRSDEREGEVAVAVAAAEEVKDETDVVDAEVQDKSEMPKTPPDTLARMFDAQMQQIKEENAEWFARRGSPATPVDKIAHRDDTARPQLWGQPQADAARQANDVARQSSEGSGSERAGEEDGSGSARRGSAEAKRTDRSRGVKDKLPPRVERRTPRRPPSRTVTTEDEETKQKKREFKQAKEREREEARLKELESRAKHKEKITKVKSKIQRDKRPFEFAAAANAPGGLMFIPLENPAATPPAPSRGVSVRSGMMSASKAERAKRDDGESAPRRKSSGDAGDRDRIRQDRERHGKRGGVQFELVLPAHLQGIDLDAADDAAGAGERSEGTSEAEGVIREEIEDSSDQAEGDAGEAARFWQDKGDVEAEGICASLQYLLDRSAEESDLDDYEDDFHSAPSGGETPRDAAGGAVAGSQDKMSSRIEGLRIKCEQILGDQLFRKVYNAVRDAGEHGDKRSIVEMLPPQHIDLIWEVELLIVCEDIVYT